MKKVLCGLMVTCLFCISVIQAFAGNRAGAVSVTAGSGYEYFAQRRNIDNTDVPFLALGYDFTKRWGIEAYFGKFTSKFKPSQQDNRQISGTIFALDGVYRFSPYKSFEPYVLAGIGVTGINPNLTGANNEGNVNAGFGTQFFMNSTIALRAEIRDFYSTVGGKNDVLIDGGVSVLFDV